MDRLDPFDIHRLEVAAIEDPGWDDQTSITFQALQCAQGTILNAVLSLNVDVHLQVMLPSH